MPRTYTNVTQSWVSRTIHVALTNSLYIAFTLKHARIAGCYRDKTPSTSTKKLNGFRVVSPIAKSMLIDSPGINALSGPMGIDCLLPAPPSPSVALRSLLLRPDTGVPVNVFTTALTGPKIVSRLRFVKTTLMMKTPAGPPPTGGASSVLVITSVSLSLTISEAWKRIVRTGV